MQQKFDKCNITVLLPNRTYVLCVLCIQPRFILLSPTNQEEGLRSLNLQTC